MATWREVQAASDSFGGDESPAGAGDETGIDDPDAGDDTTRQLRQDARSDPMSEQTEPDGGSGDTATWREVQAARESFDSGPSSDPLGGGSSGGGGGGGFRQTGGGSLTETPPGEADIERTDPNRDVSGDETTDRVGGGSDIDLSPPSTGGHGPGGGPGSGGGRPVGPTGIGGTADPSGGSPPPDETPTGSGPQNFLPEAVHPDVQADRRSAAARDVFRDPSTSRFDPSRDLERVGPGQFVATVGTDEGTTETRRFAFSDYAQSQFRKRGRERARGSIEADLERQTGLNLDPDSDIEYVETDDGMTGRLTTSGKKKYRERIESLGDADADADRDFGFAGSGAIQFGGEQRGEMESIQASAEVEGGSENVADEIQRSIETQVGRARARSLGISPALLGDTTVLADVERGRDFTISRDGDRVSAELSEEFQEELALEFAEREIEGETGADIDAGRDLETSQAFDAQETRRYFRGDAEAPPEPSARVSLTEAGVETVVGTREEQYGDVEIRDAGDIPIIGGAIDQWADAFGREPYGVSDLPRDVSIQTETVEREGRVGPGPARTRTEQRVTGVTVDTYDEEATVEDVLGDIQGGFRKFSTDVAEANLDYNPFAARAIDAAGAFGYEEEAETATRAAVREGIDILNPGRLALTVKEAGEFAPYAARETAAGRLGVSYDAAQTRETRFGEVAAPITVEEEGLAPRAAEDVEVGARAFADYARENPFEVAGGAVGSLVISGAVMGGAAAVSSRAGLATRLLIQPGEEALGYGGYYATRAASSARTAERLFPNKEPLLFSEEAAIRGARRGVAGAQRGAQRIRTGILEGGTDRGQLQLPRGRLRGETVEEPQVGTELDPFEVSDMRLYDPAREFGEAEPIERFIDEPKGELPQDIGPGIGPAGEAGGFRGGTVEENWEAYLDEQRQRQDIAQESFIDTGQRTRPRVETSVETAPLGAERLGFEGLGMETNSMVDVGTEILVEPGFEPLFETEVGSEAEFEFETETELGYEFEQEFEPEWELESEQEYEAEIEQEFEFEFETETETELELETDERERRSDDTILGDDAGWAETIDRSLLNPITGE